MMSITVLAAKTEGVNLGNASLHPVVRELWLWSEEKMVLEEGQEYLHLDPAVPATPCILALPTAALGSLSSDVLCIPHSLSEHMQSPMSGVTFRLQRRLSHPSIREQFQT